ncbi:Hypothetical_protein [Hexamita inflata]|uniref:Hypothetical_protein n=1 Tax=Hexamita inflata TaxID=28002 RepID=A0ABP1H776_9EUKA
MMQKLVTMRMSALQLTRKECGQIEYNYAAIHSKNKKIYSVLKRNDFSTAIWNQKHIQVKLTSDLLPRGIAADGNVFQSSCQRAVFTKQLFRISRHAILYIHNPCVYSEFTGVEARAKNITETLWSGTIKYLRSEAMWNCVSQLSNLIQFSLFSLKSVPKHHRMSKTSKLCVAPLHGVFKKILEKDKHIESYKL